MIQLILFGTSKYIVVKFNYLGAYEFIEGKIVIGKKVFTMNDTVGVTVYHMGEREAIVQIPKKMISGNSFPVTVLIKRGLGKEIDFSETFPGPGETSFTHAYIKKIKID